MSKNLKFSLWDAFFFSLMVGVGETYLPAWGLSIGMSEVMSGFFATLPILMGSLVQMITPWGIARIGDVKKWVVFATSVQAVMFLPLIYFSGTASDNYVICFLIVSIYWGAGFAAGPSWNYWMTHLVDSKMSSDFFSKRTRISQMGIMAGILLGGLLLHYKVTLGWVTTKFSFLFLLAFAFRAMSSLFLSLKDYSFDWNLQHPLVSLRETFWGLQRTKEYRIFFGFLFLFFACVFVTGPFVTAFLLEKRAFSYMELMLSLSALFAAKVIALPFAAKWVEKYGLKNVLLLGALGLSPMPALWPYCESFWAASLLQASSGFFWALFEVSLALVFFGQLHKSEKIPVLTFYNLFHSSALIIGTVVGGQWLARQGETLKAYYEIFVGGSVLRVLLVLIFIYLVRKQNLFITSSIRPKLS